MESFAEKGMRTLVFSYKKVPKDQCSNIDSHSDEFFESEMELLGCSGVEDMLQDDVKKCVTDFHEAGIRTWILTGDKCSTARSIGLSTGVFMLKREIQEVTEVDFSCES